MLFRWLAVAVLGLHLVFLAYVVTGGLVAWLWPRTLGLHLVAVTWGMLIIFTEAPCPLTWLQNLLRERGGQARLDASFIDSYVVGVFYPSGHELIARVCVAGVVAVSWFGLAQASHGLVAWSAIAAVAPPTKSARK